ncbi:hypothetical protein RRSWK_03349 [Rhodopirellula sp. SWK7]|nr:hypothetical protein RRSWK_03349 [Rhodopirellula sp. SWK7]
MLRRRAVGASLWLSALLRLRRPLIRCRLPRLLGLRRLPRLLSRLRCLCRLRGTGRLSRGGLRRPRNRRVCPRCVGCWGRARRRGWGQWVVLRRLGHRWDRSRDRRQARTRGRRRRQWWWGRRRGHVRRRHCTWIRHHGRKIARAICRCGIRVVHEKTPNGTAWAESQIVWE